MVEKKEERNQQKKGFVEWFDEKVQALGKVKIVIIYLIITFPLFMVGSYRVTWNLIGEGLYAYSEEAYDNIKVILDYDIVEGVGIDTYHMINATGATVKKIIWFGKDNVSEEELATIATDISQKDLETKVIDEYEIIYEDGKITLCCEKRIGEFFTARVTQEMDSSFNAISTTRNYEFEREYLSKFQIRYAICIIGGAFVAWTGVTLLICMIAYIVKCFICKFTKKADNTEIAVDASKEMATES